MTDSSLRSKGKIAPLRPFFWVQVSVVGVFVLLLGRLWQLQVLSGEHYFRKSTDNVVKEVDLPPDRGQILDRHRRILADNRPWYDVYVVPNLASEAVLRKIAHYLKLTAEAAIALREDIAAVPKSQRFSPLLIFEDVGADAMALIESQNFELPGVSISAVAHRSYPNGKVAAHLIGYLNEIGGAELAVRRAQGYRAGDAVGRSGLERQWESYLRGKAGVERVLVDARGRRKELAAEDLDAMVSGPHRTDAEPGRTLITTIDLDLQRATEKALARHRSAAAAVVDVESGAILAMASVPEPDPNSLTGRLSHEEMDGLNHDPGRPLIDKTLRENYFPGSTFKIVTALAALEDHLIDPKEAVHCNGEVLIGRRWFHCVEPHGVVDLHAALVQSCNVYFFELADRIGLDRIAAVASDLGFGVTTGVGINSEVPGFIPTMDYYKRVGGFQKGLVLNTAIGQGSVKVTVLQLAMAYAAVANGGRLFVPQLVSQVETADGHLIQHFEPQLRRQLRASSDQLARLRSALSDAVNTEKGTSWAARVPGLSVAGKTGTAQVGNRRVHEEEGSQFADHAWFASFAPTAKPEIAVVVLVEHGGFGAKAAAPTAMEIYRAYFSRPGASLTANRKER